MRRMRTVLFALALIASLMSCAAPAAPTRVELEAAQLGPAPGLEDAQRFAREHVSAWHALPPTAQFDWAAAIERGWYSQPFGEPQLAWTLLFSVHAPGSADAALAEPGCGEPTHALFFRDGALVAYAEPQGGSGQACPCGRGMKRRVGTEELPYGDELRLVVTEIDPPIPLSARATATAPR